MTLAIAVSIWLLAILCGMPALLGSYIKVSLLWFNFTFANKKTYSYSALSSTKSLSSTAILIRKVGVKTMPKPWYCSTSSFIMPFLWWLSQCSTSSLPFTWCIRPVFRAKSRELFARWVLQLTRFKFPKRIHKCCKLISIIGLNLSTLGKV